MEWQPIETAPKDGTNIDVWAQWDDLGTRFPCAYWIANSNEWMLDVPERVYSPRPQVTHWMPLPAPPAT